MRVISGEDSIITARFSLSLPSPPPVLSSLGSLIHSRRCYIVAQRIFDDFREKDNNKK